jgi:DnaK suppressor protein
LSLDAAAIRAALAARLDELRALGARTKEDRAPVELDQTAVGRLSRMDSLQAQAMAVAAGKRRYDEARRIEAALTRLDDGEFGYCVKCGEEIGAARLNVDLTIPTCIKCAR